MYKLIPCLYFILIILDFIAILDMRRFVKDFLLVHKNRKYGEKIYKNQSLLSKITLGYIRPLLNEYVLQFSRWHRTYLIVIYTLIPQYVISIACYFLIGFECVYVLSIFSCIKLIVCIAVRINVDSLMRSVYRRK